MAELKTPDLCIIGAGPAGISAAIAARRLGAETMLVEAAHMGGMRLTLGSLAARGLAVAAGRAEAMRRADVLAIRAVEPEVDFAPLQAALRELGAARGRDWSVERLEGLGVETVAGQAAFADRHSLVIGDVSVRAHRFLVATGSRPLLPEIPGLRETTRYTSETIFDLAVRPSHLIVIGAGPRALELAQAYRRLGAAVTVLDSGPALPGADPELRDILLRALEAEGIALVTGVPVTRIALGSDGTTIEVATGGAEAPLRILGSHLLVAAGRRPAVDALGLDRAGVRLRDGGARGIAVSAGLRTTNLRIFAAGDVTGAEPSDQLAAYQGELAVRSALLGERAGRRLGIVPSAIFTDPGLAEIGVGEPEAAKRLAGRYRVHRVGFGQSDRAAIAHSGPGLAKLITDISGRIIGGAIVGPEAGELVAIVAFAMDRGLKVGDLAHFVPPYPAYADLLRQLGAQAREEETPPPVKRWLVEMRRHLP